MEERNRGTVGTALWVQRGRRHKGTVGTKEQGISRNRGTVCTERQWTQRNRDQ